MHEAISFVLKDNANNDFILNNYYMEEKVKKRTITKIQKTLTTNITEAENIYYSSLALIKFGHYRQAKTRYGVNPKWFKNQV